MIQCLLDAWYMKARVGPVQSIKPHRILAPTRDSNQELPGPQSRVVATILPLHTSSNHYTTAPSPGGGGEPKNEALLFQSTVDIHFQNAHKTHKKLRRLAFCTFIWNLLTSLQKLN